ncbi:hypothetical protein A2U01_0091100, partial [Trifolium medium]|nr:hypothetical protein [Trifolium medium]
GVRPIGEGQARVVKKGETGFGDVAIPVFRDSIVFRCMRWGGVMTYTMSA